MNGIPTTVTHPHYDPPTRALEPLTPTGYEIDPTRPHVVRRTTRKGRHVWATDTPAFTVDDDGTVRLPELNDKPIGRVEHRSGIPNSYARRGVVDGWCIVGEHHHVCFAMDAEWAAVCVAERYAKAHPLA